MVITIETLPKASPPKPSHVHKRADGSFAEVLVCGAEISVTGTEFFPCAISPWKGEHLISSSLLFNN